MANVMQWILLLLSAVLPSGNETAVDFDNQIIPVITKAGCNTGACHGAAVGRGGFKLSLYGSDPTADYQSMVLALRGRRVNLAHPEESLVVLKPTESIAHGGGYRLEDDGEGAHLLREWVRQGAKHSRSRELKEFRVSPIRHVADRVGATIKLAATAKFSDGVELDVTGWTVFTAEDPAAVDVDPSTALATLLRRGRQIVVARYLDHVEPIELCVPLSDAVIDLSHEPLRNYIDERVIDMLSTLHIPVAPIAVDETFLRRVTLDVTGRLPSREISCKFLGNQSRSKRDELIDELLSSDEFTEYWTWQLAKLLRIRSLPQDSQTAPVYHLWLKQQIADQVPYDELARQLLLAVGDSHEVGPANFYRSVAGAREQAEFVSELFMGSRLRCANCHNHPLDRWTQDDYHGLAAIFAKIESGRVIKLVKSGEVTHPRTGEAAVPRIPGESFLAIDQDGRQSLATWLTDRKNPYFAKAIVNRLWKSMMGRGLVEPTDDFRSTNPATHPALLEQLAADFVESHYDLRHLLRQIATSTTYSRSGHPTVDNQTDDRYYSHALTRPLPAEILADAISDLTGVADQYGAEPLGTRAVALVDAKIESGALDILGRCSREDSCENAGEGSAGLSRMLHLFNGPLLNQRIAAGESRLLKLLAERKSSREIVDEFYQLALGRGPNKSERDYWTEQMEGLDEQRLRAVLEDFVWSLLSCREFVTNH